MSWALLISGGGFKGIAGIPVMERLVAEHGWPDWIGGTSIGAALGAMLATKDLDRIRNLVMTIDKVSDAMVAQPLDPWNGLFSLRKYRRILEDNGITRTQIPCSVGVVDMQSSRHQMLSLLELDHDDKMDAIVASGSQPFIHQRAKFKGRYKVDGGVKHVTPMIPRSVGHASFDAIRVVNFYPLDTSLGREPLKGVDSSLEQLGRSLDILMQPVFAADIRRLRRWGTQVQVEVYAPPSWESIGETFKHDKQIRADRLALGEWMADHPVRL